MPKPWEVTPDQAKIWAERDRKRRRDADRQDFWIFELQLANNELLPTEPETSHRDPSES